jgi:hypothetical protein
MAVPPEVARADCTGRAAPAAIRPARPIRGFSVEDPPRRRDRRRWRPVREMAGIRTRVRDPANRRTELALHFRLLSAAPARIFIQPLE